MEVDHSFTVTTMGLLWAEPFNTSAFTPHLIICSRKNGGSTPILKPFVGMIRETKAGAILTDAWCCSSSSTSDFRHLPLSVEASTNEAVAKCPAKVADAGSRWQRLHRVMVDNIGWSGTYLVFCNTVLHFRPASPTRTFRCPMFNS